MSIEQRAFALLSRGREEDFINALQDRDFDENYAQRGHTFLSFAAQKGWGRAVRLLLDRYADVEGRGKKPLHYAVSAGHMRIVEMLVEENADLHSHDSRGLNILHYAAMNDRAGILDMLLCNDEAASAVEPLMEDEDNNGDTPFAIAIEKHSVAFVKVALRHGIVDSRWVDRDHNTYLHLAVIRQDAAIVKALSRSYDYDYLTATNARGLTPSQLAGQYPNQAIISTIDDWMEGEGDMYEDSEGSDFSFASMGGYGHGYHSEGEMDESGGDGDGGYAQARRDRDSIMAELDYAHQLSTASPFAMPMMSLFDVRLVPSAPTPPSIPSMPAPSPTSFSHPASAPAAPLPPADGRGARGGERGAAQPRPPRRQQEEQQQSESLSLSLSQAQSRLEEIEAETRRMQSQISGMKVKMEEEDRAVARLDSDIEREKEKLSGYRGLSRELERELAHLRTAYVDQP